MTQHAAMNETSLSLLNRLRRSPDSECWERLAQLYSPLIRSWLRRYDVQSSDVDDLLQEVLLAVSKEIDRFEHAGRAGAFRSWLKTILINRLRRFWRARKNGPGLERLSRIDDRLEQLSDPASELSLVWNRDHDRYVLRQLMAVAEPNFEAATWTAFCRVALEGTDPGLVAKQLGISRNAVIIAKSRVLNRLRRESDGLIESSSGFLANS
ncbi:MAG: sigma-70 family RNA polymerase sigma factor [Fuerstiella sp.]